MGDSKMSKHLGNVIYADDLVDLFGVDAVRYYLLHEIPYDNDGSITWDLLVEQEVVMQKYNEILIKRIELLS